MARLRVDWHIPNRLASSLWNASVARNLIVHITCHKQRMAPRCVALQRRPQLCTQFQEDYPQKRLMSQLSSCASKFSLSLNTRSLPIAPFIMSSNTAKAAIVFNDNCACFYIHSCNCRHMGVLIVHVSQMCTSVSLRTNCVHIHLL